MRKGMKILTQKSTATSPSVRVLKVVSEERQRECRELLRLVSVHQESLHEFGLPHRRVAQQDDLHRVFGCDLRRRRDVSSPFGCRWARRGNRKT